MMHLQNRPRPWKEFLPVVAQVGRTQRQLKNIPRDWFARRIIDFDLWLVCDGEAALIDAEGRHFPLSRGSVVWLAPGDDFELRLGPARRYGNIYVHFDLLDDRDMVVPHKQVDIPPTTGFVEDVHYFEATLRRIMLLEYQRRESPQREGQAIKALTSQLLKGLLQDYELAHKMAAVPVESGLQKHHSRMISSALSWLYLNPDSDLGAAELARRHGYSQRHFCRIFRSATGKTPAQVLIAARIDHAKKLLASSSLNITEIAESLCYRDVFYFSHQFKQRTGMSPGDYRRRSESI